MLSKCRNLCYRQHCLNITQIQAIKDLPLRPGHPLQLFSAQKLNKQTWLNALRMWQHGLLCDSTNFSSLSDDNKSHIILLLLLLLSSWINCITSNLIKLYCVARIVYLEIAVRKNIVQRVNEQAGSDLGLGFRCVCVKLSKSKIKAIIIVINHPVNNVSFNYLAHIIAHTLRIHVSLVIAVDM